MSVLCLVCEGEVPKISPLAKCFLCFMEVLVRRNTKAAKDLDREVAKVCVSAKHCSDCDKKRRINRRHDNNRAKPVGPRTISEASIDSQPIANSGSNQLKLQRTNML